MSERGLPSMSGGPRLHLLMRSEPGYRQAK